MPEPRAKEKAVALLVIIATILVVMGLASAMLNIMSSHYRLTHHQVSRIQAYYGSMAGINYAYERLENNIAGWSPVPNETKTFILCREAGTGCNLPVDSSFPISIKKIEIKVSGRNVAGCDPPGNTDSDFCVSATTDYSNPS